MTHSFSFTRSNVLLFVATLLLALIPGFTRADTPASSILFEQTSDFSQMGKLSLLEPDQELRVLPTPPYTITNPIVGNHTLFVEPPPGVATRIEIYDGTILLKAEDTPQISFGVTLTSNLRILVKYVLTDFGDVGVSSYPPGVPFVLSGPRGLKYEGVTPMTYEKVPIGSYGVTYSPKGCPTPPPQGGDLKKNNKIYLTINIECETFQAARGTEKTASSFTFNDVDAGAWYAEYAVRASKLGIMSGYKDENGNSTGEFGPTDLVTLGQLAKITHVLLALDENEWKGVPRNKSAQNQWFAQVTLSAEQRDWRLFINPDADLTRPATRGEVLVTFLQAMDIPLQWPKGDVFHDVNRRTPYASAIETAAAEGFIEGKKDADGKPNGMFGPEDNINRAELAKLVSVVIDKSEKKSSAPARSR